MNHSLSLGILFLLLSGCVSARRFAGDPPARSPLPVERMAPLIEGKWLMTIHATGLGSVRTVMDIQMASDGFIEAHSRPGALADLVGGWKSFWARLLSNGYEHGAFLHLYGHAVEGDADSLLVRGSMISPIANLPMEATLRDGGWKGRLGEWGTFEARRFTGELPLRDYGSVAGEMMRVTGEHIFNPSIMKEDAWNSFRVDLQSAMESAGDDMDALFAFSRLAGRLNISHFNLTRAFDPHPAAGLPPEAATGGTGGGIDLSFPAAGIAVMRIPDFSGGTASIDSAFRLVDERSIQSLIIDLRDNPGGDFSSMRVAAHLIGEPVMAGVLIAREWWRDHDALPAGGYDTLPTISGYDGESILKTLHAGGIITGRVTPVAPRFTGRLFVLINSGTASAAEPLAALLQETGRGKLIGERTRGYMLSSETYGLADGWMLRIPTADYYTAAGRRLENAGVAPDLPVASASALEEALRAARVR
ncbi:MAG: S41 family peptidase [Candidatus Kapaibacterium sp.]